MHSVRTARSFFFNDTATTEIYTLSLHDALPIPSAFPRTVSSSAMATGGRPAAFRDRKSTRLNSSHVKISYAVFCLKKKNYIRTDLGSLQAHGLDVPSIRDAGSP